MTGINNNRFGKYRGKKVLIVGMGRSGKAALNVMSMADAEISVYDARDVEWDEPALQQKIADLGVTTFFNGIPVPDRAWDFVILSPGVNPAQAFIDKALSHGATLTGDLELAYELGSGKFIGITGTNGKTTTTTLTGEIFKNAGVDSIVTGNIGKPTVTAALSARADTVLITEISSFQLETARTFRPKISAMLNLTPDHLDRHGTMENYAAAKAKIFENQEADDVFVYNFDDKAVHAMAESCSAELFPFSRKEQLAKGAFVRDGRIVLSGGGADAVIDLIAADALRIPGMHNLENALAAAAIAYKAGIDPAVIAQTLKAFRGVAHRMELCGHIDDVRYVNDSKGTNPDAAIKALEAVDTDIVLIAGGYDKHTDFREFINAFDGKVKHLILLGETAKQIRDAAESVGFTEISDCGDLSECVILAHEIASPGDTVLLSPACASWDMYANFEERGEHFKQCVADLPRARNGR
ncbi:MAG: UDP-N-acetylmuramoyl-L-alanine--D-glutamate ligase [Clostridiales Family XIII bacterium]|jgi:UDP-N-acetylmuramoylalanine--D-glutamate ligase|nr:UDP-N-acetylmuramoyl-L-alanine--D-glutamate ligase [Clostridiales Family XIII bacterium]